MKDLYEILQLTSHASPEDVRKSYFRLVRLHPPEKDPDGFKAIRTAFETLSDPKSRADYDAMSNYGDEIVELMAIAEDHVSNSEWMLAVPKLKEVLVVHPGASGARLLLGICYIHEERFSEASATLKKLVEQEPENVNGWLHLGHAYIGLERFDEARHGFLKALKLQPFNQLAYLGMSKTYEEEKSLDAAIEWAEKALHSDGKIDFDDLEVFLTILRLNIFKKDNGNISKTGRRLAEVVPSDEGAHEYVAFRLMQYAAQLTEVKGFEQALECAKLALGLNPFDSDISAFKRYLEAIVATEEALTRLLSDSQLGHPIKALAYEMYLKFTDNERGDFEVEASIRQVLQLTHSQRTNGIQRIRTNYWALYQLNSELWDAIYATEPQRGSDSSCFVVSATLDSSHAEVLDIFRKFRDETLLNSLTGRAFVRFYYKIGPWLAIPLQNHPFLRALFAPCLIAVSRFLQKMNERS